MNDNELLYKRFDEFKKITKEEKRISELISRNFQFKNEGSLLDIGSAGGKIANELQTDSNKITLIDVDEFKIESGAKFVKSTWEDFKSDEKFDVILASHVWGHFYYNDSMELAFNKALEYLEEDGTLILCFNTNEGFMEKMVDFSKALFTDFQFDIFDEKLLSNFEKTELNFSLDLKTSNFSELTDLIQVLIITPDSIFENKKSEIENFLRLNLSSPSFIIHQKIIFLKKARPSTSYNTA